MSKVISKVLLFCATCCLFSGCASIIHGTRQQIGIATIPAGATVSDGENTVVTPGSLNLKRDRDYVLTITKTGYETENVKLTQVISGAVAGNILAGGLIGWGVDAISGAQWRLEPETISINLRALPEVNYNPLREEEIKMQKTYDSMMGGTEEEVIMKLGAPKDIQTIGELKIYKYYRSFGTRSSGYAAATGNEAYDAAQIWETYDHADVIFKDGRAVSWKGYVQR